MGEDMKRYKRTLFICIAVCSLFLGGCGESLHELTAEEENLIVHYSAYVVAKHNIQQKDGMSGVYVPEAENSETVDVPNGTENPEGGNGTGTGDAPVVEDTSVTLAAAIGHSSDLVITYTGSYVADNYIEGSVYSVDADAGKTFYIMKFMLTNITQEDVVVENVTKNLGFKLSSGELSVKAESTFLMTDFSTYYGTISAGQSVETVILFEVPEGDAEGITAPALQILLNNELKNVKL